MVLILFILSIFVAVTGYQVPLVPDPFGEHCIVGEKSLYPPPQSTALPKAIVNLDLPPEKRWTELVVANKEKIQGLIDVIKNLSFSFFQGKLVTWIDQNMNKWDELIPSPYREELKGISMDTGIPLGELVLYNVFYEVSSVCTAILAHDKDGNLFHARNMDFGIFMGWNYKTHDWEVPEHIRTLQTQVEFQKNGKYLFEGTVFPGFVGQFSAIKKGLFTVTMNERYDIRGGWLGLIKWLFTGAPVKFSTYLVREVLETAESYDDAKHAFTYYNVTSPNYILLGGNKTNEGCLIVRSLTHTLGITELKTSPTGFYILQTNYDPWADPLYLDDRRGAGNRCMQKLGQENVGFEGLFNVLSSPTNFNLLTIYTHLMQVNNGTSETYTQKCQQPCWAF